MKQDKEIIEKILNSDEDGLNEKIKKEIEEEEKLEQENLEKEKALYNKEDFNYNDKNLIKTFTNFLKKYMKDNNVIYIKFDPDIKYQDIIGFGGAFTGSTCYCLANAPEAVSNAILDEYFNEDINIVVENNAVARRTFKLIKNIYGISPRITVRNKKLGKGYKFI